MVTHIAFVRSVYVDPAFRSVGVARRLLGAVLHQAAQWGGIELSSLSVTAGNAPAIHLYESLGFVEVGRRPRALRVGGAYFDELDMVRFEPGAGDLTA